MIVATLILPVDDNDGASLQELHKAVEGFLLARFGGFSASLITGKWADAAGTVYEDVSIRYEVWSTEVTSHRVGQRLVPIASFCLANSQQKAIGMTINGTAFIAEGTTPTRLN